MAAVIAETAILECYPGHHHQVCVTDKGRLILPAHSREEIDSELAIAAMRGQPCGCVGALIAWRFILNRDGNPHFPELRARMAGGLSSMMEKALETQRERRQRPNPKWVHDRTYGPMEDRLMSRIQYAAWNDFAQCDYRVLDSATGWEVSAVISEPGTNPLENVTAYDFIIQSEPFVNVHQLDNEHGTPSGPRLIELGLRRSWLREVHLTGRSVVSGFFVLDAVPCDADMGGVPRGLLARYAIPGRGYKLRVQEGYMVESPCGKWRGLHKSSFEDAERLLRLTMKRRG